MDGSELLRLAQEMCNQGVDYSRRVAAYQAALSGARTLLKWLKAAIPGRVSEEEQRALMGSLREAEKLLKDLKEEPSGTKDMHSLAQAISIISACITAMHHSQQLKKREERLNREEAIKRMKEMLEL